MKPRLILLSLIGLLLVGGILRFIWRPGPSIRFTGFHEGKFGKVASFQIVNGTDDPYSFTGYSMSTPFYSYKIQEASGWKVHSLGWCGTGAGCYTVSPHAVVEIEVPVPHDAPSSPFKAGVYLMRDTPGQSSARRPPPNVVAEFIRFLRNKIQPGSGDREPTWSDTAPL